MKDIKIPSLSDTALLTIFIALLLVNIVITCTEPEAKAQTFNNSPIKVWMVHVDGKGTIPCMTLKTFSSSEDSWQGIYCVEAWREDK